MKALTHHKEEHVFLWQRTYLNSVKLEITQNNLRMKRWQVSTFYSLESLPLININVFNMKLECTQSLDYYHWPWQRHRPAMNCVSICLSLFKINHALLRNLRFSFFFFCCEDLDHLSTGANSSYSIQIPQDIFRCEQWSFDSTIYFDRWISFKEIDHFILSTYSRGGITLFLCNLKIWKGTAAAIKRQ